MILRGNGIFDGNPATLETWKNFYNTNLNPSNVNDFKDDKIGVDGKKEDMKPEKVKGIINDYMMRIPVLYTDLEGQNFIDLFQIKNITGNNLTESEEYENTLYDFFSSPNFVSISQTLSQSELFKPTNNKDIYLLDLCCKNTQNLLNDPNKNTIISNYISEFKQAENNEYYKAIFDAISNNFVLDYKITEKKIYSIIICYLFKIANMAGKILITKVIVVCFDNDDRVNIENMITKFTITPTNSPATVDPRQFLTINRFTKFRQKCDKLCFLFHGVGTGKTISSLTIAISNLNEKNLFNNDPRQNGEKERFRMLVMGPQGLFFSAFGNDASILSMYVFSKKVIEIKYTHDNTETSYILESFVAYIKNDDNSHYELEIIGFDYIEITQKLNSIEFLKNYSNPSSNTKINCLIADEAHKLLTERLLPMSNKSYDIYWGNNGSLATGERTETHEENLRYNSEGLYGKETFARTRVSNEPKKLDWIDKALRTGKYASYLSYPVGYMCPVAGLIVGGVGLASNLASTYRKVSDTEENKFELSKKIQEIEDKQFAEEKERGEWVVGGDTVKRTIKNNCFIMNDYRFFEFMKQIQDQTILLTGTPIQKSVDDMIMITKFLNLKELNASNTQSFCNDVMSDVAADWEQDKGTHDLYFKRYNFELSPQTNFRDAAKRQLATGFLAFSAMSAPAIENLKDYLTVVKKQEEKKSLIENLKETIDTKQQEIIQSVGDLRTEIINTREKYEQKADQANAKLLESIDQANQIFTEKLNQSTVEISKATNNLSQMKDEIISGVTTNVNNKINSISTEITGKIDEKLNSISNEITDKIVGNINAEVTKAFSAPGLSDTIIDKVVNSEKIQGMISNVNKTAGEIQNLAKTANAAPELLAKYTTKGEQLLAEYTTKGEQLLDKYSNQAEKYGNSIVDRVITTVDKYSDTLNTNVNNTSQQIANFTNTIDSKADEFVKKVDETRDTIKSVSKETSDKIESFKQFIKEHNLKRGGQGEVQGEGQGEEKNPSEVVTDSVIEGQDPSDVISETVIEQNDPSEVVTKTVIEEKDTSEMNSEKLIEIDPSIITGTEADGSGIDENKVNEINDIIDTVTDTYKEEEELTVAFELSETENKNLIALFKEEGIVTHIRTLDAINKDTGIAIENIQKFIKKLFRTIECKSFYDNAEYDKYQFRCKTDIFDFEVLDILKIPLGVLYGESTKDSAFYSSTISRVFDGVENNVGNHR